jgi:hypothetical protein
MRHRFAFLTLTGLFTGMCAIPAMAQPTTGYEFRIYAQGGAAPISSYAFLASEVTCGRPSVSTTGTVANPRYLRWSDPANGALDCVWDSGATSGPLFSLPFSSSLVYEGSLRATNVAGAGSESARSNLFTRPGAVPGTLGNLRVTGS